MKKIITTMLIIITLTVTFAACSGKGNETATATTTTTTTTTSVSEEITETTETTTKVKLEVTQPSIPEWCEEVEVYASELPMKLEGVTFKKALLHKATEKTENELMEYGDDPYLYNHLYVFVEGNSSDLEIVYNTPYTGAVTGSAFYEDHELVWHDDGLGTKELNIFLKEGEEIRVSGFGTGLTEVAQKFRMFTEIAEVKGTTAKMITVVFE